MPKKPRGSCVSKCESAGGKRTCYMTAMDSGGQCRPRTADEFDSSSFFEKRSGKAVITIGCPRGEFDASKKRCKVGTRALKMTIEGS